MSRYILQLLLSTFIVGNVAIVDTTAQTKTISQTDKLNMMQDKDTASSKTNISTFLTFQKEDAEAAMNFYIGLFENSKIDELVRWGAQGPGKEGTIMSAKFTLSGKQYMCSDSPPVHAWDFTPAVSNFVDCKDEGEVDRLYAALSEGGQIMMPAGNYGFSQKFGWVQDKFGVSWQLNLP